MPDREKVIEALEHCTRKTEPRCTGCPYFSECAKELLAVERDALELLRGQEPQETRLVRHYSRPGVYADLWLHCEKCGGRIDDRYKPKYCPECGRRVKWDAVEER